ncbi:hypothetical protein PC118_g8049 [Phytophthora cactorum]|uniref:Uncharacterized protein n=1 Tax=Phytophthora cactorum TaxID=29920 RepID=A0A8T0ZBP3_9STRA|nr:hypothetical protein PC111_g7376 [Phytophthora cactorum]KAG2859633.1 hypothetical protein PC113_g8756 [Phytophthora cactorum]KAG2926682.1 hypothetical protein PC115_g7833 [Phytophthora cactorum]KAG2944744.1 hypothetical protein PC117_g8934 [Phytophthora cactorum]KAG2985981.1 hypothetical protein PC118_g8049 [Phytophthora cactorum]
MSPLVAVISAALSHRTVFANVATPQSLGNARKVRGSRSRRVDWRLRPPQYGAELLQESMVKLISSPNS